MLYEIGIILYLIFWYLPWGTKVLSIGIDMMLSEHRAKGFYIFWQLQLFPLFYFRSFK